MYCANYPPASYYLSTLMRNDEFLIDISNKKPLTTYKYLMVGWTGAYSQFPVSIQMYSFNVIKTKWNTASV